MAVFFCLIFAFPEAGRFLTVAGCEVQVESIVLEVAPGAPPVLAAGRTLAVAGSGGQSASALGLLLLRPFVGFRLGFGLRLRRSESRGFRQPSMVNNSVSL